MRTDALLHETSSEKGAYHKGKEFAPSPHAPKSPPTPLGSNFFPFREDPFLEGASCTEDQTRNLKVVSLV